MCPTEKVFEGSPERLRTGLFVALLLIINIVMDGLPKVSSPALVQTALIPFTVVFLGLSFRLMFLGNLIYEPAARAAIVVGRWGEPRYLQYIVALLEAIFIGLFVYEGFHFSSLGYRLLPLADGLTFGGILLAIGVLTFFHAEVRPAIKLAVYLAAYAAGHVVAIASFPLNYLRSDMLPVIFWADRALLAGQNPYQRFYVADRIYDFPYLPGMLLVFAPAQALHLDLRWASIAYIVAGMWLIYRATSTQFRPQVVLLIGLFVLCPYLQYRHELYTQGHFFSLILIFFLMQRRLFAWSAAAFGFSMVISQFTWVIVPFFLLNAFRRGGWKEFARVTTVTLLVASILLLPFFAFGTASIAHNAVGQWDRLDRPIARPMNLAFWASYAVRPVHLKWIQLVLLSGVFCFCWLKRRCATLEDTLRWMIAALLIFILFNVLVDGYFYLMLLVPMLVYTCVANGWWTEPTFALAHAEGEGLA